MIERINKNEERLDKIISSIKELERTLNTFKNTKKDFILLNKYYGSPNWFKDKELYEKNKIPKIKAGVLSEDAIWDIDEDIKSLLLQMQKTIEYYSR